MKQIILVTGPARSGKSEWAEKLAVETGRLVVYLATAQGDPSDGEWSARIAQHQQRRPLSWKTLLVPVDLPEAICSAEASYATHSQNSCLLVDSLGTWVANLLELTESDWDAMCQRFLEQLQQGTGTIILVAEETGWGVIPAYPMGRKFRDRLGKLTRLVGAIANPVYLVTGGHVLNLSILGSPLT